MLILKEKIPAPTYPMKEAEPQRIPVSLISPGAEKDLAVRGGREKEVRP